MRFREYSIVDSDGHVIEPNNIWSKYIEPEFKDSIPVQKETVESFRDWVKSSVPQLQQNIIPEGQIIVQALPFLQNKELVESLLNGWPKEVYIDGNKIHDRVSNEIWLESLKIVIKRFLESKGPQNNSSPGEARMKIHKQMHIDIAFLYPTIGLWLFAIDTLDSKVNNALVRAYNNWLHDFCQYDPQALRGVGALSLHDPEEMVNELRRVAGFGWKAVYLRANPVHNRLLGDARYEPFWSECEKLNIAVSIHEGTHARLPTTGSDRFTTRFARHACSHPMEQMMAFLAMLEGGVLERHPNLRVAFLEAGCGWVPYWLWRLDEEYEKLGWEVADNIKMKPSDYFRRQCFVSFEPDEPYIKELLNFMGEDCLLFGSDYPHMDHGLDIVDKLFELETTVSKEFVKKSLWDNPARYYNL